MLAQQIRSRKIVVVLGLWTQPAFLSSLWSSHEEDFSQDFCQDFVLNVVVWSGLVYESHL